MDEPEDRWSLREEADPEETFRDESETHRAAEPLPSRAHPEEDASALENPLPADEQGWRERYIRLKADLENVKRNAEAEKVRLTNQGKDAVLDDIFPIVDHLQRAMKAVEEVEGDAGILQGIEMVYNEFMNVLDKHGVKKIEAKGEPFDPRIHDALAVQEHPDYERDTVVEEVRNGFKRGDSLLRPAHVIVAG
jgi:molecular chaperone GrpE